MVVIHARLSPLAQQPPRLHAQGLRHAFQHLERTLLAARLELGDVEAARPDALSQDLLRPAQPGARPLDVPSERLTMLMLTHWDNVSRGLSRGREVWRGGIAQIGARGCRQKSNVLQRLGSQLL